MLGKAVLDRWLHYKYIGLWGEVGWDFLVATGEVLSQVSMYSFI